MRNIWKKCLELLKGFSPRVWGRVRLNCVLNLDFYFHLFSFKTQSDHNLCDFLFRIVYRSLSLSLSLSLSSGKKINSYIKSIWLTKKFIKTKKLMFRSVFETCFPSDSSVFWWMSSGLTLEIFPLFSFFFWYLSPHGFTAFSWIRLLLVLIAVSLNYSLESSPLN